MKKAASSKKPAAHVNFEIGGDYLVGVTSPGRSPRALLHHRDDDPGDAVRAAKARVMRAKGGHQLFPRISTAAFIRRGSRVVKARVAMLATTAMTAPARTSRTQWCPRYTAANAISRVNPTVTARQTGPTAPSVNTTSRGNATWSEGIAPNTLGLRE